MLLSPNDERGELVVAYAEADSGECRKGVACVAKGELEHVAVS